MLIGGISLRSRRGGRGDGVDGQGMFTIDI